MATNKREKNNNSLITLIKSDMYRYDKATNLKGMIELAVILDQRATLSLEDKYMLASAPINTRSPLIKRAYLKYVNAVLNHTIVRLKVASSTKGVAKSQQDMLVAEDEIKKISLYLWLAYKLPSLFPDKNQAEQLRFELNQYCENSLKQNKALKPMVRYRKSNNQRNPSRDNNRARNKEEPKRKNYNRRNSRDK